MREALYAHLEGLKLAVEAADTAASRSSMRRLARSLAHAAQACGAHDLADGARRTQEASDATLAQSVRDLLVHGEAVTTPSPAPDLQILLVEDDRVQATMLHALLKRQAHRVHVATSAEDAERLLREHPIDVLLLDLVLPDRDGRDLLIQLRQDPATARLPVVVLSGHDGAVDRAECLAMGASDFLVKPPDPRALRVTVARVAATRPAKADTNAPGPAADSPRPTAPRQGPTRVLLVEDDRVTATLIRHRLVRDGMEVADFANGEDAYRWTETSEFDVAILDVKVPGMDGFELLGRLRATPRFATLPVIMLTALGGEADVVRGLGLGASDYMAKPFSPAELLARVRRLLPSLGTRAIDRPSGATVT